MQSIIQNQKKPQAIEAGLAFRQAYDYSKNYKAILWVTTFVLATVQLAIPLMGKYGFDAEVLKNLEMLPVIFLALYVLCSSFGKAKMKYWHDKGCKIQNLHDYLALGVGTRIKDFEIFPSEIKRLYKIRVKSHPTDAADFANWWDGNLDKVSFQEARITCAYSTFSWEVELRKNYQTFLQGIFFLVIAAILIASYYYQSSIKEILLFAIVPFIPFISLVLEEIFDNKSCINVADSIRTDSCNVWYNVHDNKLNDVEINEKVEDLMNRWRIYRLTTLPIFEWLYKITQKRMNMEMVTNTSALVEQLKARNN